MELLILSAHQPCPSLYCLDIGLSAFDQSGTLGRQGKTATYLYMIKQMKHKQSNMP